MLEVTFYRDAQQRLSGISALGHVDFADYGEDVVCAAVSAVLQAARLGLAEYARAELTAHQEPGMLELAWPEESRMSEAVQAIAATAELALDRIAQDYPDRIRLHRRTVERSREARARNG